MYGLPYEGLIAQELLKKILEEHGYTKSQMTPGLWSHKWCPIQFTLVVDHFGVQYIGDEHAEHLISVVKKHYELTHDLNKKNQGTRYCGVTMDWDYEKHEVHLSVPGYVTKALQRFKHELTKIQNQPYPHVPPNYGVKFQFSKDINKSPLVSKEDKKFIMEVTGTFLFNAIAVDSTMLPALSDLAYEQSNPTEAKMKRCKQFLDYAAPKKKQY